MVAAWSFAIVATLVVLGLPSKYQSRAEVFVDSRSVLTPLLQGLAVGPQTQDHSDAVRRVLLSRPSLDVVARKNKLYDRADSAAGRERLLAELADLISIRGDTATGFYVITYTDTSPTAAQHVVSTLLDTFVGNAIGADQVDTDHAQTFFAEQVADYEKRLTESEQRLADFKKKNLGLMPDQRGDYFVRLQVEVAANDKVRTDLAVAQRERDELRRKILSDAGGAELLATTPTSREVQAATALDARIRDNKRQLDELLTSYTDKHPSVIAIRNTIARLEEQRAAELGAVRTTNGSRTEGSAVAIDPVMQNLQIATNNADVQVASLQTQLSESDRRVAELRRLVTTGPEIEAELARLNRDYGVNKAQYEALLQRFENARLSSDANRSQSVRVKIVEAPEVSLRPISPNRLLILLGVLLVAVLVGAGVAILLAQLRPVFLSRSALESATGLPLVGLVTDAPPLGVLRARRRDQYAYATAGSLLVAFVVALAVVSYPASDILRRLVGLESV
jgi:protein tyrosine kinase modulator